MPPDMDKSINTPVTSPGYETSDANARGVFNFLVILGLMVVFTALVCWGMFDYFTSHIEDAPASTSPFAETRQLPLGPQLQVHPRRDLLQYREQEEKSLESYSWENQSAGIVRVPIERAMDLLAQKGLPVQGQAASPEAAKPAPPGGERQ